MEREAMVGALLKHRNKKWASKEDDDEDEEEEEEEEDDYLVVKDDEEDEDDEQYSDTTVKGKGRSNMKVKARGFKPIYTIE